MKPYEQFIDGDVNAGFIYNGTGANLISNTINSRENTQNNKFLGADKKNPVKKSIEMFAETAEEENMKKMFHVQTTECLKTRTHGNSNDGTDTNEQARYVDRKMEPQLRHHK